MKQSKLFPIIACTGLLFSCGGVSWKEVSAPEFQTEIGKVDDHEYAELSIAIKKTVTTNLVGEGENWEINKSAVMELLQAKEGKTVSAASGSYVYTYDSFTATWATSQKVDESLGDFTVLFFQRNDGSYFAASEEEVKLTKYYMGPGYKTVYEDATEAENQYVNMRFDNVYDKHAYMIYDHYVFNSSVTMDYLDSEGFAYTYASTMELEATIVYSDTVTSSSSSSSSK